RASLDFKSSRLQLEAPRADGAPARLDQLIGDESGERCAVEHEERGRGIPSRARTYGDVAIVADWSTTSPTPNDLSAQDRWRREVEGNDVGG
ncbi:hypothetical protein EYR36_003237, partial [Pleurotus pulmonarius]